MIQRLEAAMGGGLRKSDAGEYILFTDAEADKAEHVAAAVKVEREKTAAIRAELVGVLEQRFQHSAEYIDGIKYQAYVGGYSHKIGERLVGLGAWKHQQGGFPNYQVYRPIELRDSGATDA